MAYQMVSSSERSEQNFIVTSWLNENTIQISPAGLPNMSRAKTHLQHAMRHFYALAKESYGSNKESFVRGVAQVRLACNELNAPLEKLPTRVRLKIYRHALGGFEAVRWSLMPPRLAAVNRRMRDEVLPVFYAESRFALTLPPVWGEWKKFRNSYASAAVQKNLARIRIAIYRATVTVGEEGKKQDWEVMVAINMTGRAHDKQKTEGAIAIYGKGGQSWEEFINDAFRTLAENNNIHKDLRRDLPVRGLVAALCELVPFSERASKLIWLREMAD